MVEYHGEMTEFLELEAAAILIRIVETEGSTPRDLDAFMLVNASTSFGTIGGGSLEYDAVKRARDLLNNPKFANCVHDYKLGPNLGQCCGGGVQIKFERFTSKMKTSLLNNENQKKNKLDKVVIFGAGHVGRALNQQLRPVPLNVTIIDSRPPQSLDFLLPEGCKVTAFPENEIRKAQPKSAFVVLTHDHALDFLLVAEALKRNDAAYIGMIGSETKKMVLKNWLIKNNIVGFEEVFTPLGASIYSKDSSDKRPAVIASFTIAEILRAFQMQKKTLPSEADKIGSFE